MKKFFAGLLLIVFCMSFAVSAANVQEETPINDEVPVLSVQLTDYINRVFTNQENVVVHNCEGQRHYQNFLC